MNGLKLDRFMKIFIVIPAYNESKRIKSVIDDLLSNRFNNIVVVDDGSKDNTADIARAQGVKVVKHFINRGMGAALQTGNEYALQMNADIIVHFDADGQMQAKDISQIIAPISIGKADVVLGSRFLGGSSQIPFSKRFFILPVSRIINLIFTGIWLTDAHNGFRALSRQAAGQIVIRQDRMAHNSEIIEQTRKLKLRYQEISVNIVYHEYGQSILGGIKIIRDLLIGKFIR